MFRFFHPIEVRFGDLDPQRHVNHAAYFTYMEVARFHYIRQLGLWDGSDFDELGIIVGEAWCRYQEAIRFGQAIRVGVRTARIGNKSIHMEYALEDSEGKPLATGRTVMVAYDYRREVSIPVPSDWRRRIEEFEGRIP